MDIDIFQLPGILWRRKHYIVLAVIGCLAAAMAYVLTLKPVYTSSAELLLDPASLSANGGDVTSPQTSMLQDQSSLESQLYVVLSSTTLENVVQRLDLTKDTFLVGTKPIPSEADARLAAIGGLREHLSVQRAGQSLVMTISASHRDPVKAAEIANGVAQTYLEQVDGARSDAARRASGIFQVQASELRDRVLKAELAVENFKSENGLVSTGEGGLVVDQQLAGINNQLIAAREAEEQQRTIYEQAQKLNIAAIEAGSIPEVLQSATMNQLRDRYTQLLDRQTQLSATLGSGHPQLRTIRSQVENMQQTIGQELTRIRQSMKASYDRAAANTKSLVDRLDSMTQTSFDSEAAQIKMRQLESEAEAVRAIYRTYLNRAEELGQQQTVNTSNSRVITDATPNPTSQSMLKLMILAAAGMFGVALGTTLAVAREVGGQLLVRMRERQTNPQSGALQAANPQRQIDLPVIARIPVAEPRERRSAMMFFLQPKERHGQEITSRRHLGVLKSAESLLTTFHDHLPARVVFIAASETPETGVIISEIVQALIDCGQDVVFAPGRLQERKPMLSRAGRGTPAIDPLDEDQDLPRQDILQYERLTTRVRARLGGRPTYSAFLEQNDRQGELILIDATHSNLEAFVPSILRQSDAFIVMTDSGLSDGDIARHLQTIAEPMRQRALGQIVLEQ